MNIYFHIDELNRDAVVASALKKKLAKEGHHLIYGNRVTNRLLKYFHKAFDVIIVPRPHVLYDNWGDQWISWDVKFVMLSSESLGIICQDHQVMARTLLEKEYFENKRKYVDRIDAFCFWGSKQLQAIKDYAEDVLHKCHVVGHPRHDASCISNKDPAANEVRPENKMIGVITRAVALNDYFGRSALDCYTTLLDNHFQYEFFNKITGEKLPSKRPGIRPADILIVQAIDAENTLKIISSLENAGYRVSVRAHPKENTDVWKNLLMRSNLNAEVSDSKLPIAHWLENIDYIVGPPSTSFYDACMRGVTPISICALDSRRKENIGELWEDNNRLMNHIYKPKTIEDLLEYIKSKTKINFNNGEILNILKEEADYPTCISSLHKVIAVCTANIDLSKNRKLNLIWFMVSRFIFNRLWRVKNKITKRRENSAMFAMGRKETCFIDSLTSAT